MATLDELIAKHRDADRVLIKTVVTGENDGDDFDGDIFLLESSIEEQGGEQVDVTIQLTNITPNQGMDGGHAVDSIMFISEELTELSIAWLERCGYTVTPPATT